MLTGVPKNLEVRTPSAILGPLAAILDFAGSAAFQAEMEKMWQPGNLVARKFFKDQALAESFWILLLHFLISKQFGESIRNRLAFLEIGYIFYPFFHNIPKMQ